MWDAEGRVVGFIALIGNEVGALFVDPRFHGTGVGRALMNRARELHGELEVEVFRENAIGRAFYVKCGFELVQERLHKQTGFDLLRYRLVG